MVNTDIINHLIVQDFWLIFSYLTFVIAPKRDTSVNSGTKQEYISVPKKIKILILKNLIRSSNIHF